MATIQFIKKSQNKKISVYDQNKQKIDLIPTYIDLHLDLRENSNIGLGDVPKNQNDIKVDYDYDAIKNSLRNIFSTKKGEKILNPEFGANLEQYLFERVDEFYANLIGEEILRNISEYEPRIEVENISILPLPDQNMYKVFLNYKILRINSQSRINFEISNGQFVF